MARNHIRGHPIVGPHFVASCGRCNVPPWEFCGCSPLMPRDSKTRLQKAVDRVNEEAQMRLALALEDIDA